MGLSSKQREVKHLVETLKTGTPSSRLAAATKLQGIAGTGHQERQEVSQWLMKGSAAERRKILESAFDLADAGTRDDEGLLGDHPALSMTEMVVQEQFSLALDPMLSYLNDELVMDGAAGVDIFTEHLSDDQRDPELERALLTYADRILHSQRSDVLISRSGHHALRLLDLLVQKYPYLYEHHSWDHIPLNLSLRQHSSATKSAVLQLIRSSGEIFPMGLVISLIPSVLNVVTSQAEAQQVRCLGFSALAALLRREIDAIPELQSLMPLCCSVLLRTTG